MISFEKYLEINKHCIEGSAKFLWKCFGPNARFLDCKHSTAIYDTNTFEFYEIYTHDEKPSRWINSNYYEAYIYEAESKNIDLTYAYDDVKFVDVKLGKIIDHIEKLNA